MLGCACMLTVCAGRALLLQVKQNGLVVFVPKYGIEGPVYLTPKDAANNANATQQVRLWVEPLTMLPADVAMAY